MLAANRAFPSRRRLGGSRRRRAHAAPLRHYLSNCFWSLSLIWPRISPSASGWYGCSRTPARVHRAHDLVERAWLDALAVRADDVGRRDVALHGASRRSGTGSAWCCRRRGRTRRRPPRTRAEMDVGEQEVATFEAPVREHVVDVVAIHELSFEVPETGRRNRRRFLEPVQPCLEVLLVRHVAGAVTRASDGVRPEREQDEPDDPEWDPQSPPEHLTSPFSGTRNPTGRQTGRSPHVRIRTDDAVGFRRSTGTSRCLRSELR